MLVVMWSVMNNVTEKLVQLTDRPHCNEFSWKHVPSSKPNARLSILILIQDQTRGFKLSLIRKSILNLTASYRRWP